MMLSDFYSGETWENRQASRKRVLATTGEALRSLAGLVARCVAEGSLCVVGSDEEIERAKGLFDRTLTQAKDYRA
jgi:Zn-dependent M16 (insulinase) family peptidase